MPGNEVGEKTREELRERAKREFPGCKALQDIHYYRYMKEIEWQGKSSYEIVKDIKSGANKIKKEMRTVRQKGTSTLLSNKI